ncbi:sensor histidine kinase [Anaeromicropila herbilytica]|uniref:histidine kinase n=1 Tax=Anaeromicropila herbilytica TaxID=2785025 RepID=A0A7R7EIB7_9FIRM|nr:HAMP domain-containing sensor histidine kinase [Anaeromicropila herbilytica]BCN29259.1 hypothetical protein bsdtb5_05540 [Anaeromicropila herbilytica]
MGKLNRIKKSKKTLTSMVVKAVYGIGCSILTLTACILLYLSAVQNHKLLTPEIYVRVINVIVIGYIIVVIFLTILFPILTSRKIKKKGQTIINVVEKIKSRNLDFEITPSGVKEIDQILSSMDDMRLALKQSLENEWRMEHNRKQQISALTHDLKTPITILKGNLELMQTRELDNLCKDYLQDAKGSLEQMELYLNQLLEMTRAERGYHIHKENVDIARFIEQTVSPLSRIASEKRITILTELVEKDIVVAVDSILFERVINNLITNAIDFTPADGCIKIILNRIEDYAMITIKDTGTGFSNNTLKHGTEQFYMEDASRGRKNHYGLGLFIADSIVKQHSGIMKLANDEGTGGAKVIIQIPILKE